MNKPFNVDGLHFVERILLATLREFLAMYNGGAQNLRVARGLVQNIPGCAELIPPLQAQRNAWRPEIRALVDGLRLVRAAMLARKLRVTWDDTQEAAEVALQALNSVARGFQPEVDCFHGPDFDSGHTREGHVGIYFGLPSGRYARTIPPLSPRVAQATAAQARARLAEEATATQLDLPSGGKS
ncbi:MAG: hypothetical protein KAT70_03415 [Thermoplasmata archaeon]|nr:hypothetical protein [Thermoplasmata archaeon]